MIKLPRSSDCSSLFCPY